MLDATTQHTISIVLAIVVINLAHKIWGEQAPTCLGVEEAALVLEDDRVVGFVTQTDAFESIVGTHTEFLSEEEEG